MSNVSNNKGGNSSDAGANTGDADDGVVLFSDVASKLNSSREQSSSSDSSMQKRRRVRALGKATSGTTGNNTTRTSTSSTSRIRKTTTNKDSVDTGSSTGGGSVSADDAGNEVRRNKVVNHRQDNNNTGDSDDSQEDNDDVDAMDSASEDDSDAGGARPSNITVDIDELRVKSFDELIEIAKTYGATYSSGTQKSDLLLSILKRTAHLNGTIKGSGVVEVLNEGFGFLRSSQNNYKSSSEDMYISPNQIRRFGLRTGDVVAGEMRVPRRNERYFALNKVNSVNGGVAGSNNARVHFDDLTPLYPTERLVLEIDDGDPNRDIVTRVVDLITPLGKGQRALIVAPPRTGKTMLMQSIAHSITQNHPEVTLMVLLIDERPEEVTDMSRSVKGEVVSSTFDESPVRHVQLAELIVEKAKRLVESGKDVVILLDSITRLARAYNTVVPSSGKVLTGGVDSNALQRPKRFFGAARNVEEGGSLTIIATALVDTGSRMDEVIFEEFKGTGNAEINLDRKISDKRVFPAIDVTRSGTRKEEMLYDRVTLNKIWMLRRIMMQMGSVEAMEFLRDKLKNSKTNQEFFEFMNN